MNKVTFNFLDNFGKNVRPWKPGESGNLNGRPKGKKDGFKAKLRRMLKSKALPEAVEMVEALGFNLQDDKNEDVLAAMLVIKASSGDLAAMKVIGSTKA